MGSKPCTWVRARLPLLAGGDGLGLDRRPIERHLIVCAGCRSHLAALRETQDVLRAAAALAPTRPNAASLWPALALQIRETRRRRSSWPVDGVRAWIWPGLGLASGLFGALVILGLSLGSDARPLARQDPAPEPAVVAPSPSAFPEPRDEFMAVAAPAAEEEGESDSESEGHAASAPVESAEVQFSR